MFGVGWNRLQSKLRKRIETMDQGKCRVRRSIPRRRMLAEQLENRLVLSAVIGNNLAVGDQLQNYRLAIAATAEYTALFGGQAGALAAIETFVDDVNEIFEKEMSISFELVSGTNTIFTDSGTDGYSNGNTGQMLGANTGILNGILGSNAYDIGHVFGTFGAGGSGLAGLGVVGTASKGNGASVSSNPQGSGWVNLVGHEFGHQFGADHTFNANAFGSAVGSRAADAAYEPASGSTIMSYAGISDNASGDDNLQLDPDDYFHSASFEQVQTHIANVATPNSTTATGNNIPTVSAGSDFTVPAGTPFELNAIGSDADLSDSLTYTWEQLDLGPAMSLPIFDNGSSPLFRSFVPSSESNRVFPRLEDLIDNVNTGPIGEALPTTTRPLNFRATVRDGNNGVNSDDVLISVVDTGSVFAVTSPNTAVNWTGGTVQNVAWNVAGTDANGIDVANVAIELSLDGGMTYPLTLESSTANDGSHSLTVPNIDAANARLRVRGIGNVFFDISNVDFAITSNPAAPGVTVIETGGNTAVNEDGVVGGNDTDTYSLALNTVPAGAVDVTVAADPQTEISADGVTYGNSVVLSLSDTTAQTIFVRGLDDALEEALHFGTISHSITSIADPMYPTSTLINPVSVQIADDELQPLVGIDFDVPSGDSPSNWTKVTTAFDSIETTLLREDGVTTGIGLTIQNSGAAGVAGSTPDQVPSRSPRLDGIDGARFTEGSIRLTWDGLTPGTDYNLYVMTSEFFSGAAVQTVVISGGAGNPMPFTQDTSAVDSALLINDGIASPSKSLEQDAIIAQANADGEIEILVTKLSQNSQDDAFLSAVAIQEIGEGAVGFNVVETGGSTLVSESGTQDTVEVSLKSQPVGTVVIDVTSSNTTEASVSPATLTFDDSNWNIAQAVTITGVNDFVQDGSVTSDLTLSIDPVATTDDSFDEVGARVVSVVTQDDDRTSLVGVDFENSAAPNVSPNNWTTITGTFTTNNVNLTNEQGDTTDFDLSVTVGGGATTSDSGSFANVPDHTPVLSDLAGLRFASGSLNLTWSDLTPGVEYNIWLFAQRVFGNQGDQTVTITGGGANPGPFTMNVVAAGFGTLMVNSAIASPANSLQTDAVVATADSSGEIQIVVSNTGGEQLIGLNGAAIQERVTVPAVFDFGDAPTSALAGGGTFVADYPVTLANDGARHAPNGATLGPTRDAEIDGTPSAAADADDLAGPVDDEDGVTFTSAIIAQASSSTATLDVDLQNADATSNLLDAWIDFNRDGDWSDPGEQIFASENLGTANGVQNLTFNVPADSDTNVQIGETFARFRLSSGGALSPTGSAPDGEVEDHRVNIVSRPEVESVEVNSGAAQRSIVTELTVTFDREVNAPSSAFILTNRATGTPISTLLVSSSVVGGKTVSVITFGEGAGIVSRANGVHSLEDGNYQLQIVSGQITDANGGASLAEDYVFGDQESDAFFRWFGDSDGDRDVDGQDYGRFGLTFLKSLGETDFNTAFDSDGDGDVDGQDYGRFGQRFLSQIDF